MEQYNHFKQMVNDALGRTQLNKRPSRLYQPISYILSLGGKRLRPVLLLVANDLFGGKSELAMNAALGVEIFHNFTLLHDDIMDKADYRRGKETVHKKWNSNIAILSGDTMFAIAYQQMHESDYGGNISEILQTFTNTAIEVCEGQQYDMDFETSQEVAIPEYLNMIRLKTAVLLGCSLKIGALTADASIEQSQLLYDFGVNIGMSFQLKDDYLDAFGDYEKFGKKIGGDIAANKKTYLYLKCLELASVEDQRILQDAYLENNEESTGKITRVLQLFDKYNIKEHVIIEMERYFNDAVNIMQKVEGLAEKKDVLLAYAEWLYKRDY